jgi:hypothetical protein
MQAADNRADHAIFRSLAKIETTLVRSSLRRHHPVRFDASFPLRDEQVLSSQFENRTTIPAATGDLVSWAVLA